MAQRRAFRRLPPERLRLEDYFSNDLSLPDAIYASEAAVIEGYEFDRLRFRVAGPIFRSVDLTHWLALDVADQALKDAGFSEARGLPLETTGVVVGNTLTGEFSRAAAMRLRWPYVRRVVETRLGAEGWDQARRSGFLDRLEEEYKAPFPIVGEETLAGALSNTIAGRICNYFHFGGGGYTIDGACAASLLGVARACSALEAGEIDVALAGGVDLSLDPFELVGFAKAGALAHGEMRIYDKESNGFLPGEGSGFVVLIRQTDAIAQHLRIYAVIRGWGVSSDGGGGITRPEVRGQKLALERAYRRAGYEIGSVAFFEGHGTGTPVGDDVELKSLSSMLKGAGRKTRPAAIGSIKANLGHTKASAGIAGLIKATLAVHDGVLPPTTGVLRPRHELEGAGAVLRVMESAEPWPPEALPPRAGINSFGFGGINVHVTIEGIQRLAHPSLTSRQQLLASSPQDCELFLFSAESQADLANKLGILAERAPRMSYAELGDASEELARHLTYGSWRAALVAATPQQLSERIAALATLLGQGVNRHVDPDRGVFLGVTSAPPRIGFLFPGQASPVRLHPGVHGRRFARLRRLYDKSAFPITEDLRSTRVAQVAITTSEIAGLMLLTDLGVEASVAIGHSLGELTAYYWAGAIDEDSLLSLVRIRGKHMADTRATHGQMASISAPAADLEDLLRENDALKADKSHDTVVVACFNAPCQVVVSGESSGITRVIELARARNWSATLLPTEHAFHSHLMLPAVKPFQKALGCFELRRLRRRVISTITGTGLQDDADLRLLLTQQFTAPVQFSQALAEAAQNLDLFIEVGPGNILAHLARCTTNTPAIALDVAGPSMSGLLHAAGATHVLGTPLQTQALFGDRFTRPFDFRRQPSFFSSPCYSARPGIIASRESRVGPSVSSKGQANSGVQRDSVSGTTNSETAEQIVRALVSRRTELPPETIPGCAHLLRDLHLNSIVVGEIVAVAAQRLGIPAPQRVLEFADVTVSQVAQALDTLRTTAKSESSDPSAHALGVDEWSRPFIVEWIRCPLRRRAGPSQPPGSWQVFPLHHGLGERLLLSGLPGNGVLACLSEGPLEDQTATLLKAAHIALAGEGRRYFVVLGGASVAAGFARTVHLEDPEILTRIIVVHMPEKVGTSDRLIGWVSEEVSAPGDCLEARYSSNGERSQCMMKLWDHAAGEESRVPLGRGDVILVSGGGKGIVAHCAAMLGRETGAALLIVGRSRPEEDAQLTSHLENLTASGVRAKYFSADVTDSEAVRRAIEEAQQDLGQVSAVIHGAGLNDPKLLRDLDNAAVLRALAPKAQGFRNLVSAVDVGKLRLLVTFGSVIGRTGMRGEAHYALANAYQSQLTEEFAQAHPDCRCLSFESSAWSGIGMAERLGSVETLRREGIATIAPETGASWLRRLLSNDVPAISVMLAGRLGRRPPLPTNGGTLPLRRFLDRPRVYYPGVELVAECELSTTSDPYLLDHVFQGQPLLPGVLGLEAMAQAAMAVTDQAKVPIFKDVRFERPIAVARGSRVKVRVAALTRERGLVEVALRSSETAFQVDHFRCVCSFAEPSIPLKDVAHPSSPTLLPIEPEKDLYGKLLFQTGRFRRLVGYRFLDAFSTWADIAADRGQAGSHGNWFSQHLPGALVLGDPGARDCALHSVQACVPHAVLLPIGVKRLYSTRLDPAEKLLVHAQYRWRHADKYCYDVELRGPDGVLRERWEELQLAKVADAGRGAWPDSLAAAYLEWRAEELMPGAGVTVAFQRGSSDRRSRNERATEKVLQSPRLVVAHAAQNVEAGFEIKVSTAHSDRLTLAVARLGPIGCDLEPVSARSEQVWQDLLGYERWRLAELIAREAGEDVQTAATRVWTAIESLKKVGVASEIPITLLSCSDEKEASVSLSACGLRISSSIVQLNEDPRPFAVSIVERNDECATTNIVTT